jgi:hypothetical protein
MKTSKSDFRFTQTGYGRYDVHFTSNKGRVYGCSVTDMTIIDATKNSDNPKRKDLEALKRKCKQGQRIAESLK